MFNWSQRGRLNLKVKSKLIFSIVVYKGHFKKDFPKPKKNKNHKAYEDNDFVYCA